MDQVYQQSMKKIVHHKISETAMESIKLYIIDNNVKAGDILPSESELSKVLGISRASIREAFRSLEALGIISTIQGKGRYLRDFNYDAMVEHLSYNLKVHVNDFREIIDVRMALEESFLKKVITIMPEEDIVTLENLLAEMKEQITNEANEQDLVTTHTLFHQTLYKRLNNTLLENLIGVFSTFQRYLTIMKKYKTSNYDEFISLHQKIIDLIRSRDNSNVHECLEIHFKDVMNWSNDQKNTMV